MKHVVKLCLFFLIVILQSSCFQAFQCNQHYSVLFNNQQDRNSLIIPDDIALDNFDNQFIPEEYDPILVDMFQVEQDQFWRRNNKRIIRLIRNHPGCLANFQSVVPLLIGAIERGRLPVIREIVEHGGVDYFIATYALNDHLQTGLMLAAQSGQTHVIKYFISRSDYEALVLSDINHLSALDYARKYKKRYGDASGYVLLKNKITRS